MQSTEKFGVYVETNNITNHSIRSSSVADLATPGVGEQQLKEMTEHANTK